MKKFANSLLGLAMDGEHKKVKLGDVCDLQNGFAFKSGDYVNSPVDCYEVLKMGHIKRGGGFQIEDKPSFVPRNLSPRLKDYLLDRGDIVIAMTDMKSSMALLAHTAEIPESGRYVLNQRVGRIKIRRPDILDRKFYYYLSNTPEVIDSLRSRSNSGVQVNLSTSAIKETILILPPLSQQKNIAEILSSLDDKIELNQRMNDTLEGIAQALFKSWFVDFDPVKAKAEGRKPEGMDDATAALFPSGLTDSPLGPIPEGWTVKSVGDLTKIIKGRSYKSTELSASEIALVTLKSFNRGGGYRKDGVKAFTGTYKTEQEIKPGELIVAFTDVTQQAEVIGKPAIVSESKEYKKLVASLDVGIVRPDNYEHILFYYFLFLSANFQSHIYGHTSGTTVLHLSKEGIPCFEFAYPDKEGIVDKFSKIVGAFYKKISLNDAQIIELSEIRDLLLPRIISGKLRLGEINETVEALAL